MKQYTGLISLLQFAYILAAVQDPTAIVDIKSYSNIVGEKFLSYSIDPKLLFSSNDLLVNNDGLCMAKSLAPAYIRIAGPSTDKIQFDSSLIKGKLGGERKEENIRFSVTNWETFAKWAHSSGLVPFFALNHDEKTMMSDKWDPKTALKIMSATERATNDEIIWQLGYECNNQSLAQYLRDLNTLKSLVDAYPSGKKGLWYILGNDITKCVDGNDSEGLRDFMVESNNILDAIFISGSGSLGLLDVLNDEDRNVVETELSKTNSPLWYAIKPDGKDSFKQDDEKAIAWINELGKAANNGIDVLFKELRMDEIIEPTMSYYASVIHKKLVGRRVLDLKMAEYDLLGNKDVKIYAHCTSLLGKPLSGAVTLFGTNPNTNNSKISIKLSGKEPAGEIMQYILKLDNNGNILVNGAPMYYAGNLRPSVKTVRPFKTLIVNLPPKSVGFWIIANSKVPACKYNDEEIKSNRMDNLNYRPLSKDEAVQQLQGILLNELKKSSSRSKRETESLLRSRRLKRNYNKETEKYNEALPPKHNDHHIRTSEDIFSILGEFSELMKLYDTSEKTEVKVLSYNLQNFTQEILQVYSDFGIEGLKDVLNKVKSIEKEKHRTKRQSNDSENIELFSEYNAGGDKIEKDQSKDETDVDTIQLEGEIKEIPETISGIQNGSGELVEEVSVSNKDVNHVENLEINVQKDKKLSNIVNDDYSKMKENTTKLNTIHNLTNEHINHTNIENNSKMFSREVENKNFDGTIDEKNIAEEINFDEEKELPEHAEPMAEASSDEINKHISPFSQKPEINLLKEKSNKILSDTPTNKILKGNENIRTLITTSKKDNTSNLKAMTNSFKVKSAALNKIDELRANVEEKMKQLNTNIIRKEQTISDKKIFDTPGFKISKSAENANKLNINNENDSIIKKLKSASSHDVFPKQKLGTGKIRSDKFDVSNDNQKNLETELKKMFPIKLENNENILSKKTSDVKLQNAQEKDLKDFKLSDLKRIDNNFDALKTLKKSLNIPTAKTLEQHIKELKLPELKKINTDNDIFKNPKMHVTNHKQKSENDSEHTRTLVINSKKVDLDLPKLRESRLKIKEVPDLHTSPNEEVRTVIVPKVQHEKSRLLLGQSIKVDNPNKELNPLKRITSTHPTNRFKSDILKEIRNTNYKNNKEEILNKNNNLHNKISVPSFNDIVVKLNKQRESKPNLAKSDQLKHIPQLKINKSEGKLLPIVKPETLTKPKLENLIKEDGDGRSVKFRSLEDLISKKIKPEELIQKFKLKESAELPPNSKPSHDKKYSTVERNNSPRYGLQNVQKIKKLKEDVVEGNQIMENQRVTNRNVNSKMIRRDSNPTKLFSENVNLRKLIPKNVIDMPKQNNVKTPDLNIDNKNKNQAISNTREHLKKAINQWEENLLKNKRVKREAGQCDKIELFYSSLLKQISLLDKNNDSVENGKILESVFDKVCPVQAKNNSAIDNPREKRSINEKNELLESNLQLTDFNNIDNTFNPEEQPKIEFNVIKNESSNGKEISSEIYNANSKNVQKSIDSNSHMENIKDKYLSYINNSIPQNDLKPLKTNVNMSSYDNGNNSSVYNLSYITKILEPFVVIYKKLKSVFV